MASKYEKTKKCPALCFEGYTYRFDKLVSANSKNDGVSHTGLQWVCL